MKDSLNLLRILKTFLPAQDILHLRIKLIILISLTHFTGFVPPVESGLNDTLKISLTHSDN